MSKSRFEQPNNIFLTGVTGVVGGRLLVDLLEKTTATIHCLVRGTDESNARDRIANMVKIYAPSLDIHEWMRTRVNPIVGDLSQYRFGWSSQQYSDLLDKIDLVIHNASVVKILEDYARLKPINVEGTSRMVGFCLETKTRKFVYVSSYCVIGSKLYDKTKVRYTEADFDIGQSFDDLGYERSKFEAEKIVRKAENQGLNWTIVRPGNVFGDSKTGSYPLFSTVVPGVYYDIIKTVTQTGISFHSDENFDVTPVDYVARAIAYLGVEDGRFGGKTYHLVNPDYKNYMDLIALLMEYGYPVRVVPYDDYVKLIKNFALKVNGKTYHSMFMEIIRITADHDLSDNAYIDSTHTVNVLGSAGIRCPAVDINLMSTYLNYCIEQNFISAPANRC